MCYMKATKLVGVRELRQNLSVHLRRVARGETLEVTERGRAVAILAPLRHESSKLERLAAAGLVIPPKGDLLDLHLARRAAPAGFNPADALADQREDRRL